MLSARLGARRAEYAAARYNAFAWVTREDAADQTLAQALAYYGGEYQKMLGDNVDELTPVYAHDRGTGALPPQ